VWATILSGLCFCGWASGLVILTWGTRRVLRAADLEPADTNETPRVSVIVAARDEAAAISPAIESLLALDCPDLEVVAVDDRSGDGTGQLLDELARRDPRLRVLHVTELPGGWLGKTHALAAGAAHATGEWLLFTDADVIFERGSVRRAVGYARLRRIDHLALAPRIHAPTPGLRLVLPAFALSFGLALRPWRGCGIGAFNLVRRGAYEASGGLAAVALRVDDDIALGALLSRCGCRQALVDGRGLAAVPWYPDLPALFRGLEKNAFAAFGYRAVPCLAAASAVAFFALWPWTVFVPVGGAPSAGLAAAALAVSLFLGVAAARRLAFAPAWGLGLTAGLLALAAITLNSLVRTLVAGGVRWRDTFYPLAELRSAARGTGKGFRRTTTGP